MARRKGPALTLQDVVEVAIEVVRADGTDALRVSRVAKELGIKPPSLYNHVGPGDALARAVVLEGNRQLLATFKDAVRGVLDPTDQLRALAEATRRWALDNGGLYTLMSRVEPDNEHEAFAPLIRDLLELYARPFGQLGVEPSNVVHAIRGLRAAVHGFVLLESGGQFQLQEDREQSFRWLVESVLAGSVAHPAPR